MINLYLKNGVPHFRRGEYKFKPVISVPLCHLTRCMSRESGFSNEERGIIYDVIRANSINRKNNMNDLIIPIQLMTIRLKKYTLKNKRLMYHLPRCNSMGATMKLTIMLAANSVHICFLTQEITKLAKELKTRLIPRVKNLDYGKTGPIFLPPAGA